MIVAPSTAVSPAIASTARATASCHRARRAPPAVAAHQAAELVERRRHRVRDRPDDRVLPGVVAGRHDEQQCRRGRARASTRRAAPARSPSRSTTPANRSPSSDVSSGGQSGRLDACSSTTLTLIAFEHGDVHELAGFVAAMMLDDEQPGAATSTTKHSGGIVRIVPQTRQLVAVAPDAQMNARRARPPARPCERRRARAAGAARTSADDGASSGGRNASEIFGT